VRYIEHGSLVDAQAAALVARAGAYIVPTTAIMYAMSEVGRAHNFPEAILGKTDQVIAGALEGLHHMRDGEAWALASRSCWWFVVNPSFVLQIDEFKAQRSSIPRDTVPSRTNVLPGMRKTWRTE
jgi:hypothetical protein